MRPQLDQILPTEFDIFSPISVPAFCGLWPNLTRVGTNLVRLGHSWSNSGLDWSRLASVDQQWVVFVQDCSTFSLCPPPSGLGNSACRRTRGG